MRFDRVARIASGAAPGRANRPDLRYARVSQYNAQVEKLAGFRKAFAALSKTVSQEAGRLPEGHELVGEITGARERLERRLALLKPLQLPPKRRVAGRASLKSRQARAAVENFFNATVNHEFNNALSAIVGFSQILAGSEALQPCQREAAGRIAKAAWDVGGEVKKLKCTDLRLLDATDPGRTLEAARYFAQHGAAAPFLRKRA